MCRRKSHGLFEITKYVSLHTCVYPRLSQHHSQLRSKLIKREIQNVIQSDHMTSIGTLHQMVKDNLVMMSIIRKFGKLKERR